MTRVHTDRPCAACDSDAEFRARLTTLLKPYAEDHEIRVPPEALAEFVMRSLAAFEVATAPTTAEPAPPPPESNTPRRASGSLPVVIINTDGASRGNPGPASIGAVVKTPEGKTLATVSKTIGRATNNEAEYGGVLAGLRRANELGATRAIVRSDSELVVKQCRGEYKVKQDRLAALCAEVHRGVALFPGGVTFEWVPREENREADALANEALDGKNGARA